MDGEPTPVDPIEAANDLPAILTPITSASLSLAPPPNNFQQQTMVPLALQPESKTQQVDLLQTAMFECFNTMMRRMDAIESSVSQIFSMITDNKQLGTEVSDTIRHVAMEHSVKVEDEVQEIPTSESMPPPSLPPVEPAFELVMENVKEQWYSERPYPPFIIKLLDLSTGEVYRQANEWCVQLHLYDGYGRNVDEKLNDDKTKTQYLIDGVAEVSGLRFLQVSSKNGMHFNLECEVVAPADMGPLVRKARTEDLIIMSCRLYTCRKGSFSKLNAHDCVSKMPGIGRQYGQRLMDNGVRTVADLANLPLGNAGMQRRRELLEAIRREKGTMTEGKLCDYIQTAQEIISGQYVSKRKRQEDMKKQEQEDAARAKKLRMMDNAPMVVGFAQPNHNPMPVCSQPQVVTVADPYDALKSLSAPISDKNYLEFLNLDSLETETTPHHIELPHSMSFTSDSGLVMDAPLYRDEAMASTGGKSAMANAKSLISLYPLHSAVVSGKRSLCETVAASMRSNKRTIDQLNNFQYSPLMLACALGHEDIARWLCEQKDVSPTLARQDGWTALHVAIANRSPGCTKLLLDNPSVNPTAKTRAGLTPLMLATLQGDATTIAALAPRSSDETHVTRQGLGLLHLAALSGSVDTVTAVMGLVEDVKAEGDVPSPLHCAAYSGDEAVVDLLVAKGADVAVKCSGGWTALHIAASRGNTSCIQALIKAGADVNAKTEDGWTALSLTAAADDGAAESAEALVEAGATDDTSEIPASMIGVVCSNADALKVLAKAMPGRLTRKMTLPESKFEIDAVALSQALGNDDLLGLGDDTILTM